jgi:major membrane immunogen (membrane-anchored lipoprotein)
MNEITKKWRPFGIMAAVAAAVAVLGCGSDESGLAKRYSVTGRVTYKGEPVPKGNIVFEPTNPPAPQGRVAQGSIENGSYSLTTSTPDDGALPGDYKVVIMSSTLDVSELAKKQGGLLHQGDADHVKAVKAAKNPLPGKYSRSADTPLKATVKAQSNSFDFPLED